MGVRIERTKMQNTPRRGKNSQCLRGRVSHSRLKTDRNSTGKAPCLPTSRRTRRVHTVHLPQAALCWASKRLASRSRTGCRGSQEVAYFPSSPPRQPAMRTHCETCHTRRLHTRRRTRAKTAETKSSLCRPVATTLLAPCGTLLRLFASFLLTNSDPDYTSKSSEVSKRPLFVFSKLCVRSVPTVPHPTTSSR